MAKRDEQKLFDPPPGEEEAYEVATTGTLSDAIDNVVIAYSFARKGYVWDFIEEYIQRPIATLVDMFGTDDLEYDTVKEQRERYIRKKVGEHALYNPFLATPLEAFTKRGRTHMESYEMLAESTDTTDKTDMASTMGGSNSLEVGQGGITESAGPGFGRFTEEMSDALIQGGVDIPVGFTSRYARVKKVWYEDVLKPVKGIAGFHSMACGDRENLEGLVETRVKKVLGMDKGNEAAGKLDTRKRKRSAVVGYLSKLMGSSAIGG